MNYIKYIDLFCGLGAFHHVMDRFNGECVFACDINDKVRKIYEMNYGIKPAGDINSIDINSIPNHEILFSGFPCQTFSIAGNKAGFDDKTKGTLLFKVFEIIDIKLPPIVILENVKNILSIDSGKTIKRIVTELENRGYTVSYKVMNAVFYGSPQCRERVFIVALRDGRTFTFPEEDKVNIRNVTDILHETETNTYIDVGVKYTIHDINSKNIRYKPRKLYSIECNATGATGQGYRIYDPNHPGITICSSSGGLGSKTGLYYIDDKIRKLNVIECLRMFGFPDNYKYDVEASKMIGFLGNSIVTNVIEKIMTQLFAGNTIIYIQVL